MAWLGIELFYEDKEKSNKKQTIEMMKFQALLIFQVIEIRSTGLNPI
jgi:hypothetical protein